MTDGRTDVCAFCKWSACYNGSNERTANYPVDYIECRRHAPASIPNYDGRPKAAWPKVSNLYWCGDFERTEEVRW